MIVSEITVGQRLRSPFSGIDLEVVEIRDGMYGLVELICVDDDCDRHLLSLAPDEEVRKAVTA